MVLSSVAGERRKDLGQFFTPPELVSALTAWAVRSPSDRVLEPAAGEAAFLLAAIRRLRSLGSSDPSRAVLGVEIDPQAWAETNRALKEAGEPASVIRGDFFELSPEDVTPFNAVVGNPPYIRYHRFKGEARRRSQLAAAAGGVVLSGLASSWAAFVIHASRFLAPDGRLAFVLPAELLYADYADPVREFLLRRFGAVSVVTFNESVFPGAMIDTVLLMAEGGERRGLRVLRVANAKEAEQLASDQAFSPAADERWSSLRDASEGVTALGRLRDRGALTRLGDVASVDIGFVTGANDFFMLTSGEIKRHGISRRLFRPAIARPAQLRGAILSEADAAELTTTERVHLLALTGSSLDAKATALGRYLRRGRRRGIHRQYKCRVRQPWYAVPGIRIPDAFLSYMSNTSPRVALNEAGFSSSNLVHQVTFHMIGRSHMHAFVTALHSSPARLSFELEGRSYGGGVLKHETKEAESVEFPFEQGISEELADLLPDVDRAVRTNDLEGAAGVVDNLLISRGVLSERDLTEIRRSREELHKRRSNRGRTG